MATTLRQYVDQQQKFNSLMAQSDPDASADEVDGKQKKVFKNRHPEHAQRRYFARRAWCGRIECFVASARQYVQGQEMEFR